MVPEVRRAPDPFSLPPIAWPDELPLPLVAMASPVSVTWPRTGYGNKAYTGREWDPETGLYYYRARYYDPKIGRFLSEDPIGARGGDLNYYAYVQNNPVNLTDPEGLQSAAAGALAVGWTIAVCEPTPVGEVLMSAVTLVAMAAVTAQEGDRCRKCEQPKEDDRCNKVRAACAASTTARFGPKTAANSKLWIKAYVECVERNGCKPL